MKKILFIIGFLFVGCKETIDFLPTNSYNEAVVWENESSVKLYINSFYRTFDSYFQYGSAPLGSDATLPDGLTDIVKYTSISPGAGTANLIMTQDNYTSVNSNHFSVWNNAYAWNRRILEFLSDLPKYSSKFTPDKAKQFEAEVRFFRAYMFFLTIRSHGVFIVRKSLNDPIAMPLNTAEECWNFIEEDLDYCTNNLPASWIEDTDGGRVTRWAALALKSRAMLYAKRWQKAADAADKVIKEGGFELEADYANIFKNNKTNRSKEIILSKRYNSAVGINHNIDERIAPSGDIQSKGGALVPTQELVDAYLMRDGSKFNTNTPFDSSIYLNRESRFYASILYNGATWKGRKIETFVSTDPSVPTGKDRFEDYGAIPDPFTTVTGYYIRKLADETNNNFNDAYRKSDQECIEIRLGEVYLNLAEALLELGKTEEAKQAILRIRNRSLQQDVTNITGDLKKELVLERMLELAFEGHRFWDLRRWGLAREVLNNKKFHGAKITKNRNGTLTYQKVEVDKQFRFYADKFNQFPFPTGELNNNPNIKTQPAGW
jgi:starch-binding outer membrane protein, SusD/RagB family